MRHNRFEPGHATRGRQRLNAARKLNGLAPIETVLPERIRPIEPVVEAFDKAAMLKAFNDLARFPEPFRFFDAKMMFAPLFGAGPDKVRIPVLKNREGVKAGTVRIEKANVRIAFDELAALDMLPIKKPLPTLRPQTRPHATSSTLIRPADARQTDDYYAMARQLSGQGHQFLGRGYTAQVYADKDDPSVVIKVARYDTGLPYHGGDQLPQDGWLQYVADFGNHPSPHRPVVHSIELHERCYVARMERLTPQRGHRWGEPTHLVSNRRWANRHHPSKLPGSLGEFGSEIEEVYAYDGSPFRLDCHGDNIMLRGDVRVVTDPIITRNHA